MKNRGAVQKSLITWVSQNMRSYPWRQKRTPYEILVVEILLKRTTAKAVSRVYEKFLERYSSIKELSKAKIKDLEVLLKPIGYYKLRAMQLKEISNYIVSNCGGEVPNQFEKLIQIPYVGPYTAGAILCFGFDISAPMVDSNVKRIMSRVFMNSLNHLNDRNITELVTGLIPADKYKLFNLALLDLGAMVCLPRRPRCPICPLKNFCDYAAINA